MTGKTQRWKLALRPGQYPAICLQIMYLGEALYQTKCIQDKLSVSILFRSSLSNNPSELS